MRSNKHKIQTMSKRTHSTPIAALEVEPFAEFARADWHVNAASWPFNGGQKEGGRGSERAQN